MEPPRHERWDPKRIEGVEGRQALHEIKEWIRERVRELNPTITDDVFNESDLGKYLPEVEDGESSGATDTGSDGGEDGLTGVPKNASDPVPIPVERPEGSGTGNGLGEDGRPNPKGGDGKNTGGKVRRSGRGGAKPPLEMRSYSALGDGREYLVILRSSEDFSGDIRLIAAGDDQIDQDVDLASCNVDGRKDELTVSGNRISNVNLQAGEPLRLRLTLARPRRVSLIVED
jgi:hypothetical protein